MSSTTIITDPAYTRVYTLFQKLSGTYGWNRALYQQAVKEGLSISQQLPLPQLPAFDVDSIGTSGGASQVELDDAPLSSSVQLSPVPTVVAPTDDAPIASPTAAAAPSPAAVPRVMVTVRTTRRKRRVFTPQSSDGASASATPQQQQPKQIIDNNEETENVVAKAAPSSTKFLTPATLPSPQATPRNVSTPLSDISNTSIVHVRTRLSFSDANSEKTTLMKSPHSAIAATSSSHETIQEEEEQYEKENRQEIVDEEIEAVRDEAELETAEEAEEEEEIVRPTRLGKQKRIVISDEEEEENGKQAPIDEEDIEPGTQEIAAADDADHSKNKNDEDHQVPLVAPLAYGAEEENPGMSGESEQKMNDVEQDDVAPTVEEELQEDDAGQSPLLRKKQAKKKRVIDLSEDEDDASNEEQLPAVVEVDTKHTSIAIRDIGFTDSEGSESEENEDDNEEEKSDVSSPFEVIENPSPVAPVASTPPVNDEEDEATKFLHDLDLAMKASVEEEKQRLERAKKNSTTMTKVQSIFASISLEDQSATEIKEKSFHADDEEEEAEEKKECTPVKSTIKQKRRIVLNDDEADNEADEAMQDDGVNHEINFDNHDSDNFPAAPYSPPMYENDHNSGEEEEVHQCCDADDHGHSHELEADEDTPERKRPNTDKKKKKKRIVDLSDNEEEVEEEEVDSRDDDNRDSIPIHDSEADNDAVDSYSIDDEQYLPQFKRTFEEEAEAEKTAHDIDTDEERSEDDEEDAEENSMDGSFVVEDEDEEEVPKKKKNTAAEPKKKPKKIVISDEESEQDEDQSQSERDDEYDDDISPQPKKKTTKKSVLPPSRRPPPVLTTPQPPKRKPSAATSKVKPSTTRKPPPSKGKKKIAYIDTSESEEEGSDDREFIASEDDEEENGEEDEEGDDSYSDNEEEEDSDHRHHRNDESEDDDQSRDASISPPRSKSSKKPSSAKPSSSSTSSKPALKEMSHATFVRQRAALFISSYDEFNKRIFSGKLPHSSEIELIWSKTLNKTAGRCYSRGNCKFYKIELSIKVCDSVKKLRETLAHEMCHAANWHIDRLRNVHHGREFLYWGRQVTKRMPELGEVGRCHSYEIFYKFKWQCQNEWCKKIYGRHSDSLDVNTKACGRCRGKLVALGRFNVDGTPAKVRPPSVFAQFVKDNYANIKAANPMTPHKEIMKLVAEDYKLQKAVSSSSTAEAASSIRTIDEEEVELQQEMTNLAL